MKSFGTSESRFLLRQHYESKYSAAIYRLPFAVNRLLTGPSPAFQDTLPAIDAATYPSSRCVKLRLPSPEGSLFSFGVILHYPSGMTTARLTEHQAIARLNSRRWRQIAGGWAIEIENLVIEAREENLRWRARARPTDARDHKSEWSYWSPPLGTRWRAALAARGLIYEQQGILPL